jgi:hypothetical protein
MMSRIIFALCLAVLPACATMAQSTDGAPCPVVRVSTPDSMVPASEPATVKVELSGAAPNLSLLFTWSISAGSIYAGQATDQITINTTGVAADVPLTATVTIVGIPKGCTNTFTGQVHIVPFCPIHALKFDEYGRLRGKDEALRRSNFAIEAQRDPTVKLVIISYGGRRTYENEALRRAQRNKAKLVSKHGIDPKRIEIVNGGYQEQAWIEFWIVPIGAPLPAPSPGISSFEVIFDGKP